MTWTTAPARVYPAVMVAVKCPWCGKVAAEVRPPTEIRTRCADRGCGKWIDRVVQ